MYLSILEKVKVMGLEFLSEISTIGVTINLGKGQGHGSRISFKIQYHQCDSILEKVKVTGLELFSKTN